MSRPEKTYANLSWTPEDVQSLRKGMSLRKAREFLERNEDHLKERLCELGWEVIDSLLIYESVEGKGK